MESKLNAELFIIVLYANVHLNGQAIRMFNASSVRSKMTVRMKNLTGIKRTTTMVEKHLDMQDKAVLLKAAEGYDPTIKLSQFNLTKQLGEGRHGTVYFAWIAIGEIKVVAIKSISKKNVLNANTIAAVFLEH